MADRKHDKDELITLDELCEMAKMTKPTYQGLRRQNVRMVRIDPPRPPICRK